MGGQVALAKKINCSFTLLKNAGKSQETMQSAISLNSMETLTNRTVVRIDMTDFLNFRTMWDYVVPHIIYDWSLGSPSKSGNMHVCIYIFIYLYVYIYIYILLSWISFNLKDRPNRFHQHALCPLPGSASFFAFF